MTQLEDVNRTKPVETPYDHTPDAYFVSEFPTYRPHSTIAPQRTYPTRYPTVGTVHHRPSFVPTIVPNTDPEIVTARGRALMHVLLPEPPRTDEEVRFCALNRDVQNHLRWHEMMLRRSYWHITTAPADMNLCMRCRVNTRSVTHDLREIHEALIWLCEGCQRVIVNDAAILAARYCMPLRQVIENKLLHERATYHTGLPPSRITLR